MKFLIDECLSLELADIAQAAGFPESAHVVHRGMQNWSDSKITAKVADEDWTFVTRNSDDFRPGSGSTSNAPCYIGILIHAGLVCLNPPAGTGGGTQMRYFKAALKVLETEPDLVNQILEVWPDGDGVRIDRYAFPDE